jgi:hypothetical protein
MWLGMAHDNGGRLGDIGALALAEVTLGELVADMLEIFLDAKQPDTTSTTKHAVKLLRKVVEEHPWVFPDRITDWLDEIDQACDDRNDILHASAEDRCVQCGNATRYQRNGEPFDRSPERVQSVTERLDALTREGFQLGYDISERANAAVVEVAKLMAQRSGEPQAPPQVLIGAHAYTCGDCTGTGQGKLTITAAPAVMVLPPGTSAPVLPEGLQAGESL